MNLVNNYDWLEYLVKRSSSVPQTARKETKKECLRKKNHLSYNNNIILKIERREGK